MGKCEVCGRESNRVKKIWGMNLCSKHMHQWFKYGKFLDSIQRTNSDLNDYYLLGETAHFNLYNQRNEKVGEFIIDKEDLEKVKYKKWRYSHAHVVTGLPAKGEQKDLSHVILDFDPKENPGVVVDHVNGIPEDNRKINLRICTQGKNCMNKSFVSNNTSGFIGLYYRKDRDAFDPEIRAGGIRCHLGYTRTLEQAVYKRYVAEQLLFGDYANKEEHEKKRRFCESLSQEEKDKLRDATIKKLTAKGLL